MLKYLILIICFLFCLGCGQRYSTTVATSEETIKKSKQKIIADAYLFDVKIKRGKKQNSFRLNLFQTDSLIALGGRGYLGKGALAGLKASDYSVVYVRTRDEYLNESVQELFKSFDCTGGLPKINLFELFNNLPDQVIDDIEASVLQVNKKDKRPQYQIRYHNCPWQLDLTYDQRDGKWRIKRFHFSDGDKTVLKGNRREYRSRSKIKSKQFDVPLKPTSARITL